jgi:hypothetical protein
MDKTLEIQQPISVFKKARIALGVGAFAAGSMILGTAGTANAEIPDVEVSFTCDGAGPDEHSLGIQNNRDQQITGTITGTENDGDPQDYGTFRVDANDSAGFFGFAELEDGSVTVTLDNSGGSDTLAVNCDADPTTTTSPEPTTTTTASPTTTSTTSPSPSSTTTSTTSPTPSSTTSTSSPSPTPTATSTPSPDRSPNPTEAPKPVKNTATPAAVKGGSDTLPATGSETTHQIAVGSILVYLLPQAQYLSLAADSENKPSYLEISRIVFTSSA